MATAFNLSPRFGSDKKTQEYWVYEIGSTAFPGSYSHIDGYDLEDESAFKVEADEVSEDNRGLLGVLIALDLDKGSYALVSKMLDCDGEVFEEMVLETERIA